MQLRRKIHGMISSIRCQCKIKLVVVQDHSSKNSYDKLVGLGSDGASVMMGRHSGVGVRLKSVAPFLVHTHCVAHSYALHKLLNQSSCWMNTKHC